jgi:hypothetical protein
LERGVAVRQGLRFLRAELPRIPMSCRLAVDWRRLDERSQEDGRLKSRALFLIHDQLGFDPLKPSAGSLWLRLVSQESVRIEGTFTFDGPVG